MAKKNAIIGSARPSSHRYTLEERIEAISILEHNNYDYEKTSMELKVAVNTLKSWNNRYRKEVNENEIVRGIAAKVELKMAQVKIDFISKHNAALSNLAEIATARALQLVATEEDLDKVTRVLKTVAEIYAKIKDEGEEQSTGNTYNFIQASIQKCNEIEAKTIRIE